MLHVCWCWKRGDESGYADGVVDYRAPHAPTDIEAVRKKCGEMMSGNPLIVIVNWIDIAPNGSRRGF